MKNEFYYRFINQIKNCYIRIKNTPNKEDKSLDFVSFPSVTVGSINHKEIDRDE